MAQRPKQYWLTGLTLGATALVMGYALPVSASATQTPRRIVSLNLCADQYLLALVDRWQIAGLTRNATDKEMSAAAQQARGLPILKGSAEEILAIAPDLVVGVPGGRSDMMAALVSKGYPMLDLPPANSYADILRQIRLVAKAVGRVERGEALVARMTKDLAAISRPRRSGVAAYYQRRGYLTGAGTLIDDMMARAGLTNLASKLGKPVLSQLTLEELIAARPDYIIIENATDQVVDQGTEMLHHPLLSRIRRLRLPQAWTVCGGPAYVDAVRSLTGQLNRQSR